MTRIITLAIVAACTGASRNLERVENVKAYDADLRGCYDRSKSAEEYKTCADATDAKHGRNGGKDAGE